MKTGSVVIILLFTSFAIVVNTSAQTPAERLAQMVAELQKKPLDQSLREKIIKLGAEIKPAPAVPPEAERFEGRAQYAFKSAKNETELVNAAREYLKAVEIAPWISGYYFDLCTILEKANKPFNAIKACTLYLADPKTTDAAEVRKRIAGMQYALEEAQKGFNSSRESCDDILDMYSRGAKNNGNISVKLVTVMNGAIPKNSINIADYSGWPLSPPQTFVKTFSLGPVDTEFRLDDERYHLVMTAAGQITLEGGGGIRATNISTSVDELTQLRLDQMQKCMMWQSSENKYYVRLIQGGPQAAPVAGYLYFETDCSGKLIGEKPGWYPAMFSKLEETSPASTLGLQPVPGVFPGDKGMFGRYDIKWPCLHVDLSWLSPWPWN